MIFETKRLRVRKLILSDLKLFHKMQSNPKVMQFVRKNIKTVDEHLLELKDLIKKYDTPNNQFWIYAIERKLDANFIGTVALIKDKNDDEIGYRFLEKYWKNGYGFEVCGGLINYCKILKMSKLVGYVADKNIASAKILKKHHFKIVGKLISDDLQIPETKYELVL